MRRDKFKNWNSRFGDHLYVITDIGFSKYNSHLVEYPILRLEFHFSGLDYEVDIPFNKCESQT
jgi:hypothetical protein